MPFQKQEKSRKFLLLWAAKLKAKPIAVEYSGEVQFAALGVGCAAAVDVVAPVVVAAAFGVGFVGIRRAAGASRAPRRPDF